MKSNNYIISNINIININIFNNKYNNQPNLIFSVIGVSTIS
jgi:hypothetical protein